MWDLKEASSLWCTGRLDTPWMHGGARRFESEMPPPPREDLHGLLNWTARSPGLQTLAHVNVHSFGARLYQSHRTSFAQVAEKVMATGRRRVFVFCSASSFQVGHLMFRFPWLRFCSVYNTAKTAAPHWSSLRRVVTHLERHLKTGTLQNNNVLTWV